MNVVFLTPYFFPEKSSSDFLFLDVVELSEKLGNKNFILCPNPIREVTNEEFKKYKNGGREFITSETEVHRVKTKIRKQDNYFQRLIRMFLLKQNIIKKLKDINFNILVVPSSPPFWINKKMRKIASKKKAKIIYNIHDIYPNNIVNRGLLFNFFEKIAIKSLKYADIITTLSHDMRETLLEKVNTSVDIKVIGTWDNDKIITLENEEIPMFNNETINVFYIGNIGEWQNIDLIINSFEYIDSAHAIHLVGGGRRSEWLAAKVKEINSPRLTYTKRVSLSIASKLYAQADANLITLNKGVIFTACPSKTPMCIKANRIIIASIDQNSKYAKNLQQNCSAIVVDPDSAFDLASAINSIKKDTFIDNSEIFVNEYSREANLKKWQEILRP